MFLILLKAAKVSGKSQNLRQMVEVYITYWELWLVCEGSVTRSLGSRIYRVFLLQVVCYLSSEDPPCFKSAPSAQGYQQSQRPQSENIRNTTQGSFSAESAHELLSLCATACFAARCPVCLRGHQDHREHHDCHHAAAVHVRLYRSAAL